MQTGTKIDKFLEALCRWLEAVNDGRPLDTYRAELDAHHPHCCIVPIPRHISRLKELLMRNEGHIYQVKLQDSYLMFFGGKVQPSQWEQQETVSKSKAALSQAEVRKHEISELEQKLRKAEAENWGFSTQLFNARSRQFGIKRLHETSKSHLIQVLARCEGLRASHTQLSQVHDDLQNKYDNLLQRYTQSEAIMKQLLRSKQHRDSGLVHEATNVQDPAIPESR
ncbi:hypothetical protein CERZMDRAFT_90861 [Cercospora zeae-maydis SCOH1-5]|uniref:Uncharacterized protein n=1 Tax=Cercospora zeae-maydis SCOH1-5 TaxID=717836 RepID=A0A6A6FE77_9PEZI|nr:hypothetical protein CERZMDRAFT_90861 [Cercospora zeae-maydis SCOH1-5]